MARARDENGLSSQLAFVLRLAGARPSTWIASTVVASLVLAGLDIIGIAAMIPLTQLITGSADDSVVITWISDVVGTTSAATLIPLVAAIIGALFVVKSFASIAFRWWLLGRTTRVSALLASELFRRYVLAPYGAHRSRNLGEVYRNVNDSTSQAASVLLASVGMCTDLVMLGAIVALLAWTAPLVTLLTVVVFGSFVLGMQLLLRGRQSRVGEEMAESSLQVWQFLMPGLDGFREARLTAAGSGFVDGFRRARLRGARASREMGILVDIPRYGLEIGFILAIVGISLLLFLTSTPEQTLTVLGVFAAASLRALPTLNRVSANVATIRTGSVGVRIVREAVDELDAGGTHDEEPHSDTRYSGDITLDRVSFHYPDSDEEVLSSLSIRVAENQTTAFVGSSGAGKSTLVDIILGLLEPTSGSVEVGGRPISEDRAAWYAMLGVVPQDVFILNDSLLRNIAFGAEPGSVDEARLQEVIGMAQLTDLVSSLPDGLDTVVGERGVRMSGGQRQRLGLARALYRRPAVLVLDEATSALDNATEHEIATTLRELQGSLTILIVAHRLSTVRSADKLIFLRDGEVAASGSFAEVRAQSPDFARMVELGELS